MGRGWLRDARAVDVLGWGVRDEAVGGTVDGWWWREGGWVGGKMRWGGDSRGGMGVVREW